MFEFFNKLLMARELRFENGRIFILRESHCIIPAQTAVDLQKLLNETDFELALYKAAKSSGKIWFERMTERFYAKKMPPKDILSWGNNVVSMAGHGISIVEKFVPKKEIVFRLENSAVAELYGKSKVPVDHLYRGYVAGAGSIMLETDANSVEIQCKSVNGKVCRFLVKPSKDFDKNDPVVKDQLGDIL